MLSVARTGVRSARSTAVTNARQPSRAASAPLPRRVSPKSRYRGISHATVHYAATSGGRAAATTSTPFCIGRRSLAFQSQRRAFTATKTGGASSSTDSVSGSGRDGNGSSSDSSESSDSEREELGEGDVGSGGEATGKERRTLEEQAKDFGIKWDDEADEDSSPRDYRSVGTEVFEGGDLEAGETLRGMYDFMDDIVETQHVPTIRDPFDMKGKFHRCPGRKQGKAALPGTCEIFNVKELYVNNTPLLKRFVNDAAMILGRNRTGLCAKCQRKVARTVKAARQIGLIPTISDFEIRDTGPGGLYAWAGKGGDHDAMAKAKAVAEASFKKKESKRFGSLV